MRDAEELLKEFCDANADRRAIAESLAESSDNHVLSAFLNVLGDMSEDDIVRVEILKGLAFRRDDYALKPAFGNIIRTLLERDDDDLIRQYAAIALKRFVGYANLLELAEKIVANPDEDIDVRHNALAAIEWNVALPTCRQALERLVAVPELGISAERTLKKAK